ncbi:hypothetical protein GT354_41475 [Streptomyces sp. SID3343]|nr:hypothetical protein [Streptomyces sp. SID3343]
MLDVVTSGTRGSVISVGIDYMGTPHAHLTASVEDASTLLRFFADWGFSPHDGCGELSTASARNIVDVLEVWADRARHRWPAGRAVVYLAGHGRLHNGRHYVLTASSPESGPYFGSKAIGAEDLGSSGAEQRRDIRLDHAGHLLLRFRRTRDSGSRGSSRRLPSRTRNGPGGFGSVTPPREVVQRVVRQEHDGSAARRVTGWALEGRR